MSAPPPQNQRLSLFPSPDSSKPPAVFRNGTPVSRRSESRERRAPTPQDRRAPTPQGDNNTYSSPQSASSPPRVAASGRRTPVQRSRSPMEHSQPQRQEYHTGPLDGSHYASQDRPSDMTPVQQPRPAADVPGRTDTAFSDDGTLVRSSSARSRSSIAKLPLDDDEPSSSDPHRAVRSIFPTYNPELPLERQEYIPTQMSPTRVPRAVISRQQTYDDDDDIEVRSVREEYRPQQQQQQRVQSPVVRSPKVREGAPWPQKAHHEPPAIPKPCTTEQLKSLWKVANGWKASASEGRVYCMKMSQEKDAPFYTLASSSAQPFYNLRLDPTSVAAHVTMTKHDPSKPYKAPRPGATSESSSIRSGVAGSSGSSKSSDNKNWHEALTTTLEEDSRRYPPNDGLVALLMPSPAAKMAMERPDDPAATNMAEQECARLVWDEDSAHYFLVHPALEHPFCVTVDRSPAWSRTEYTLEHNESPKHLAKLTRDGTGGGWMELDTAIASQIDSFYLIDVAVAALLLVAAEDDRNSPAPIETFEPPPPVVPGGATVQGGRLSKLGMRPDNKKKRTRIEEFEVDVESQDDSVRKAKSKKKSEDKLPFVLRVVVKMVKGVFKCFIWVLTIMFKCLGLVFKGLYSCVGSKY